MAVCAVACSSADEMQSGETQPALASPRRLPAARGEVKLFATSAERFGTQMPGATAAAAQFEYATPTGWIERAPTDLRAIDFAIGAAGATECYVTVLGGDGGGALANVNRWCGQVGATPWNDADLAASPRIAMLGTDAIVAALGDEKSERMLIGALAPLGSRSVFVKMLGPRAEVLEQRAAFEAFCKSLARKR